MQPQSFIIDSLLRSARSIESKKYLMTDLCVICFGPIQTVSQSQMDWTVRS